MGGKNKEAGGNRDKANGGPSKNSAFSSLVKVCDGKLGKVFNNPTLGKFYI